MNRSEREELEKNFTDSLILEAKYLTKELGERGAQADSNDGGALTLKSLKDDAVIKVRIEEYYEEGDEKGGNESTKRLRFEVNAPSGSEDPLFRNTAELVFNLLNPEYKVPSGELTPELVIGILEGGEPEINHVNFTVYPDGYFLGKTTGPQPDIGSVVRMSVDDGDTSELALGGYSISSKPQTGDNPTLGDLMEEVGEGFHRVAQAALF